MYAVIESGGKQHRVTVGDRLRVESLKLDPGSKLSLDKVLLVAEQGDVKVGSPYLGSKVEATVVGHGRGEKVRIFKLRRRNNSRQQAGHRQDYTELEIVSIDGKTGTKPVTKATKEQADEAQTAEPQTDEQSGGEEAVVAAAATKETSAEKKTTKTEVTKKAEDQD